MNFLPTCIFYNKINKIMEVYSLPCPKKKKKKKKKKLNFTMIIEQKFFDVSLDSEKDYKYYYYIIIFIILY